MAHVGKLFPSLIKNDLGLYMTYQNSPPYRMRLVTGSTSVGTSCVAWRSQDIISLEPTVDYDHGKAYYVFELPSNPSQKLLFTWELYSLPALEQTAINLHMRGTINTVDWPGAVATYERLRRDQNLFADSDFELFRFQQFLTSTNRAVIDSITSIELHAARWSDVPDYHPRQPAHA